MTLRLVQKETILESKALSKFIETCNFTELSNFQKSYSDFSDLLTFPRDLPQTPSDLTLEELTEKN